MLSGRTAKAIAVTTTKPPPAARVAFQFPRRGASRRPAITAATPRSTLSRIIRKNRVVRFPMVSGLPTAGGVAGYLRNGTR
ncbi:hypothetical protein STANM309S_04461 [Streptomyces tanashiensis]